MEEFKIYIDSSSPILNPGKINGYVYIKSKKLVKAEKITVTLNGRFESSWKVVKNGPDNRLIYHHEKVKIPLIKEQIVLWKQKMELFPDKEQKLPFEFNLDKQLPPSQIGPFTKTVYYLEAHIDQPKKSTRLDLCLMPNIQLNSNPMELQPIENSTSTAIGLFSRIQQVDLKVKLAKSTYIVGENLNVELEVRNRYNSKIDKIDLFLVQEVLCLMDKKQVKWPNFGFKFLQRYKHDNFVENQKMMAKFSEKIDIKPGESKQRNYSIQIPQIAPTYKNEENGIEVRNYIRVDVHITKAAFNSKVNCSIPITIGLSETEEKVELSEPIESIELNVPANSIESNESNEFDKSDGSEESHEFDEPNKSDGSIV